MEKITRRLVHLRNLEAINIILLPVLIIWLWVKGNNSIGWLWRLPPLLTVSFILAQGTLYWHLKLRTIRDRAAWPGWFAQLFRLFKWLNIIILVLIGAALVAALLQRLAWQDMVWAIGLWTFALAEHVNYFAYQLMHDTRADLMYLFRHKRLRRSSLFRDLQKSQKTS